MLALNPSPMLVHCPGPCVGWQCLLRGCLAQPRCQAHCLSAAGASVVREARLYFRMAQVGQGAKVWPATRAGTSSYLRTTHTTLTHTASARGTLLQSRPASVIQPGPRQWVCAGEEPWQATATLLPPPASTDSSFSEPRQALASWGPSGAPRFLPCSACVIGRAGPWGFILGARPPAPQHTA